MGGTNEQTLNGLRLHINGGEVHVHDDSKGLKFTSARAIFKHQVSEAVEELDKFKGDCVTKIDGSSSTLVKGKVSTSLCIAKYSGKFFIFLTDNSSSKAGIKNFLKGC